MRVHAAHPAGQLNLTHALDGFSGNEHALPVSPLREDVVQLFAQSRTSLAPTLNVPYGREPPLFDLIITRRPQDEPRLKRFMPPGALAAKLGDQFQKLVGWSLREAGHRRVPEPPHRITG